MAFDWGGAAAKFNSGGGKWLKLKDDGAKAQIVILDEPCIREGYWTGSAYSATPIAGEKMIRQVVLVVFNVDDMRSQILTMSPTAFRALADEIKDEAGGDPTNNVFEIKRSGTGLETTWKIRHRGKVTREDLLQALEQCDIYDPVEEDSSGCTRRMDPAIEPVKAEKRPSVPEDDDDIPF